MGVGQEKENGTTYYEIESVDGKTKRDLLYTVDGKLAEIEEAISMKDLPPEVKGAFDKEFPKAKVEKAEKTIRDQDVTYELHVKVGKIKKEVVIDSTGKILKGKSETKNKGEKEDSDDDDDDENND